MSSIIYFYLIVMIYYIMNSVFNFIYLLFFKFKLVILILEKYRSILNETGKE